LYFLSYDGQSLNYIPTLASHNNILISIMTKYKIAIVGAGPAGCTLARLLLYKKIDVEVTIFESEKGLNARTQGGTLDLHTESGIKALKECGLYEEFLELARFDAEGVQLIFS
jgi:2-polyprenyl-6-methoxyphenol hydroxylase-like FAD-dependent oxidoreductase